MLLRSHRMTTPTLWNMAELSQPPGVHLPPEDVVATGLRGLFYDGLPWKGSPTRVFAWYGSPPVEPGEKLPAMVLVHGGMGTAFADWVKLWNQRGYAAIAMDTCGCIPQGSPGQWQRHAMGGPRGWGGFDQVEAPLPDQWTHHAVADVVLAHSLLRSFPEVDPQRIGITGISWGGYLTCLAAAVDARFRFAVPVYGCGFLGEDSVWLEEFRKLGADKTRRWLHAWDPATYLGDITMPMLWVTGTNDFAYPLSSWQKSYRLPSAPRTICLQVRMTHGHGGPGENPPEIRAFADYHLQGGPSLPEVTQQGREQNRAWVRYDFTPHVMKAELNFTRDTGPWSARQWDSLPAQVVATDRIVTGLIPDGVRAYYLNLIDDRGLIVSAEHEELL